MRLRLLFHLMLAFVWMAVTGSFSGTNLLLGFVLGYVVMRVLQPLIQTAFYEKQLWLLIDLILFVIREVFQASMRIAADVLTRRHRLQPGVIAVPLDVKTDGQITLLANLISFTPGTLSLDVSDDRSTLYIHSMYIHDRDVDEERRRIKDQLERRVLAAFRAVSE